MPTNQFKIELAKSKYLAALIEAIESGQIEKMESFEFELDEQEKKNVINEDENKKLICWLAASKGRLEIIKELESYYSNEEKEIFLQEVLRGAASGGCLNILDYMRSQVSEDKIKQRIVADYYRLIVNAATTGNLGAVQFLESYLTSEEKVACIRFNFPTLLNAASREPEKCKKTIHHWLSLDSGLAYAEMHDAEYGRLFVYSFVNEKIAQLQEQKDKFDEENPDSVFNISDEEAKHAFYLLRNLIRRGGNDRYHARENCLNDIRFLLNIPAVKALCHQAVNPEFGGRVNELLQLAQSVSNNDAAELLLNIPAVREQAQRDDFYRARTGIGGMDLAQIAQDQESSMRALSPGEQKRLQEGISRYQPTITARGATPIVNELKDLLRKRYQDNPARITVKGKVINLPESFEEFEGLGLDASQKQEALQAYYQHKDHSALRYLSKPNRWMHPNASYVNVNDDRTERWSTFEEYLPVIAMLYLAVTDEKAGVVDGHSVESRVNHFIDELALIGRAHNWDRKRHKTDKKGNLCFDDKNNPVMEEYDDLEADRPSCFSGVKRRLFQAVTGHPLFKVLTEEDINSEIIDFVREHFINKLKDLDREKLKEDYDESCITMETPNWFDDFNLTEGMQKEFKVYLTQKYGEQYSCDLAFKHLVDKEFELKPGRTHLANFDAQTQFRVHLLEAPMEQLLQKQTAEPAPASNTEESLDSQSGTVSGENQILPESTEYDPKAELLDLIETICTNDDYWRDKLRTSSQKVPTGVAAIQNFINKNRGDPTACLNAIQHFSENRHSKHFQFAYYLFKGRQEITNDFYGLLSKLNPSDLNQSSENLMKQLKQKFAEALPQERDMSFNRSF